MAREWDGGVNHAAHIASMLTPFVGPGTVPFDASGLRSTLQGFRAEKVAKDSQDAQSADAAARLAFDKEKFEYKKSSEAQDFEAEQAKERNKQNAALGGILQKGKDAIASGDPGRVGRVMSEWRAGGGDVSESVVGKPEHETGGSFVATPNMPAMPDSFDGDLGPGRALESSETHGPDGEWQTDEGATPYAKKHGSFGDVGKRSAVPSLDVPHPSLSAEFAPQEQEGDLTLEMTDPNDVVDSIYAIPEDVTVTPSTERKVYEFKDVDGNVVATLDPERLKHNSREIIYTAVDKISAPFVEQFPRETKMAREMVEEWYIGYMTSPGSTTAGALEYVTDNFTKMIRNQIQADAQRQELGLPQLDLKKVAEGMKQVTREWPRGQEVADGLAAANQGHDMVVGFDGPNGHVNGLLEDVKKGVPINTNKLIDLRFQIAKTREPGGRLTDNDYKLTAGLRSVSQALGDWWERTIGLSPEDAMAEGVRAGVFDNNGNMDASISRDLAEQFERYFYEAGEARELQMEQHKPMFQEGHAMLVANNDFAGANGYARRVNTMLGEDFLPTVSANEAHRRMGLAPYTTYQDTQQPQGGGGQSQEGGAEMGEDERRARELMGGG